MTVFSKLGNDIFSPVDSGGHPRQVANHDVQVWATEVEWMFAAFQSGGGIVFASGAEADASLNYAANQMAWVIGDPVTANNGVYRKTGASGSGSWVRVGDLPYSFIKLTNAGGAANAIVATSATPLPLTASGALLVMDVVAANTGNVTLSVNGAPAMSLLTASGGEIPPGGIQPGMAIAFLNTEAGFRLLSDIASSAIVIASQAAQSAAEAARDAALGAVPNVFAPTRTILKTLNTATVTAASLKEPGREGDFLWRSGDFSNQVANDVAEGIYLKADGVDATVGAWVRQFDGPWWAHWFGFSPASTAAANVVAFNAMLDLAVFQDTRIKIKAGEHKLSARISKTTAFRLSIEGEHAGVTELQWNVAGGGLHIAYSTANFVVGISRMSLTTTMAGGGTALQIDSPVIATSWQLSAFLPDLEIRGVDTAIDYWDEGIRLTNCWYAQIDRPVIKGKDEAALPFSMSTGVVADQCQVVRVRDCLMQHMTRGHQTTGATFGEGLSYAHGEMVGVYSGIDHARGSPTSGSHIHDMHINAYYRCIALSNIAQVTVHDNLLYKTHVSSEDWQGIELANCLTCDVHDNDIATPGVTGGTAFGITLAASSKNKIHDNHFAYWQMGGAGVLVAAGSGDNEIYNNSRAAGDATPTYVVQFSGAATTNRCWNNFPVDTQSLANGEESPSVGNDLSGFFQTANAAHTNISTLDDMYVGQVVRVLINDTNTAWIHGSGFFLKGSTHITAGTGAGGFITFIKTSDGLIRECGRTF